MTEDYQKIKKVQLILRAANHPIRSNLLHVLQSQPMDVSQLVKETGLPQAILSQHLIILRRAGFVTFLKSGKSVRYSINTAFLSAFHHLLNSIL